MGCVGSTIRLSASRVEATELVRCGLAFVLACRAAAEDILNISLKSLFLSDNDTVLICIMISKNMNKLMLG